jgi:hypothetical protein
VQDVANLVRYLCDHQRSNPRTSLD